MSLEEVDILHTVTLNNLVPLSGISAKTQSANIKDFLLHYLLPSADHFLQFFLHHSRKKKFAQ